MAAPVGAFGKSVTRVYEKYKDAGIKDVSIHLYKGDRHEILNEVDRQNVYQDIRAEEQTLPMGRNKRRPRLAASRCVSGTIGFTKNPPAVIMKAK